MASYCFRFKALANNDTFYSRAASILVIVLGSLVAIARFLLTFTIVAPVTRL